jgi:thioredoxin reductase (NADPH)
VAIIVPLLLVGIAVLLMAGTHVLTKQREKKQAAAEAAAPLPHVLIHSINDDRCTGCDACVAVCPTDVLELVEHKSRVLRFGDCIQCEQCMLACPTQALVMHMDNEDPPPVKVPHLDPYYQTGVAGMYLIGEVAGKPLVKNAANIGRAVVEHMLREGIREQAPVARRAEGSDSSAVALVDVAIVGSGPGGLSAALTCMHHGLSYALMEKEQVIASTVSRYPKGKDVMAEPYDVRNVSFLPVFDATKEQLVDAWQQMVKKGGVGIKMGEAVESVKREDDGTFTVRTTVAVYRAKRVVLGTGTRGKPRTLGVPGENLAKVVSLLDDPDLYRGKDVLVVGGGDSAIEAACVLAEAGARVVLSYRGKQFNRAAAKNRDKVMKYGKERKVNVMLGSQMVSFTESTLTITSAEGKKLEMPNHHAFVLIGADPPVAWLEKLGVQFVERPHWYALGSTDQLVESLIGKQPESPREVSKLIARVRGEEAPIPDADELPPVPEASVMVPLPVRPTERPRTLPAVAGGEMSALIDDLFGSGAGGFGPQKTSVNDQTLIAGMSLAEFARQSKEKRSSGAGASASPGAPSLPAVMVAPRKKVRTQEETRILRALRDEGARLAHDESGVVFAPAADDGARPSRAPLPAPAPLFAVPAPGSLFPAPAPGSLFDPAPVAEAPRRPVLADVGFGEDESTRLADDVMLARRNAGPPPAQPAPAAKKKSSPNVVPAAAAPARKSAPNVQPVAPALLRSAPAVPPAPQPSPRSSASTVARVPGPPPPQPRVVAPPQTIARVPGPPPPQPPPPPARRAAGGPPPPQPRIARPGDHGLPPALVEELNRAAAEARRSGTSDTRLNDVGALDFTSDDLDDEEPFSHDEQTSLADPNMVANLREQLRRR